jgi:hypothetical protein
LAKFVGVGFRLWLSACLLFSAAFPPHFLLGQASTATVEGVVSDAQGAVVPGATVTVTNISTSIAKTVKSDESGRYVAGNLNPGPYELSVQSSGFRDGRVTGITLTVAAEQRVDVTLAVGSASTMVQVDSFSLPLVDTETSSVGTVVDNRKVVELPLSNRQFYSLALLSPAAYPPAQNSTLGFRGGFNVAGATETSNNFTIDGMWANDAGVGAPGFRPSIEDIQEFRLLTGVYSAEFGHNSGGQVVIVSKSGTNAYHGSAYEFLRNQVTDAEPYFNSPGAANPAFKQNTFGATIGAPIRKDKTFVFYAYEGQRIRQQITALSTVPTATMLQGLFATQIYNPYTGAALAKNSNGFYDLKTIPQYSAAAAQLGQQIASYYPAPTNSAASNNYVFSRTRVENMNEDSIRIDHTLTSKDSLMGSYNYFNDPAFEPSNSLCGSSTLPGFGCTSNVAAQLAVASWTRTLTPTMLNTFSVGYNRTNQFRQQEDNSATFPGLPGVFNDPSITNNHGVPSTSVTGYTSLGSGTAIPSLRIDDHYQILNTFSWTHNAHTIKAGVDLLTYKDSFLIVNSGRGTLSFNTASLQAVNQTSSKTWDHLGTTGNALADLLLGLPYTSSRSPNAPKFHQTAYYYQFFVQDDWKLTPHLTLNLGTRYEYDQPMFDAHNVLSNFNLATGTIQVAGQNGVSKFLYKPDFDNWGPRIGFAWQPYGNERTVLKGGYGISYNPPAYVNAFYTASTQAPFRNPQTFTAGTYSANSALSKSIALSNPFPSALAGTSSTAIGVEPNFRITNIQGWSLGVQQALTQSSFMEVTYYGSKGTKLPMSMQANQANIPNSQASRPYPTFSNITYQISEGSSEYDSLQTKLQQNLKHGVSYLLAYTWGKSIDGAPGLGSTSQSSSGTPQNSHNLAAERGLSDFDIRHRIVFSPVARLPFGKDSAYLTHGVPGALAGGWEVASIFTYQSGRPFTVTNSASNNSGSFNNADRPNLIGNPNAKIDTRTGLSTHTPTDWFNTGAFTSAPAGQFGSAGRNIVAGPRNITIDATVSRSFTFADRVNMQLRLEGFNVLNHPNFQNPYSNSVAYGTSTFGTLLQANNNRELQGAVRFSF